MQPQGDELACPVVRAGAGLHGHDAAGGQLRAPGDEFLAWQRAAGQHLADHINGMDLDHALGQIDPVAHGLASRFTSRAEVFSTFKLGNVAGVALHS